MNIDMSTLAYPTLTALLTLGAVAVMSVIYLAITRYMDASCQNMRHSDDRLWDMKRP